MGSGICPKIGDTLRFWICPELAVCWTLLSGRWRLSPADPAVARLENLCLKEEPLIRV